MAIWKTLRLSGFCFVVAAVAVLGWGHRLRAQMSERLLDAGSAVLRFEEADRQDTTRTLIFNGQPIHLSSGMTRVGLTRVLDFYENHCLERDGGLTRDIDELAADHPEVRVNRSVVDPVVRAERGRTGMVACLATDEQTGVGGFISRLHRYRRSGDVSELGDMRYIYAEEGEHGTHFVVFWTEGPFFVHRMLPDTGDAPGRDIPDVTRPPASRRVVSAWEQGAPQSVNAYVATTGGPSVAALERFYRTELPRRGWDVIEPSGGASSATVSRRFIAAEKGRRMVTLIFGTGDEGRATTTVLAAR